MQHMLRKLAPGLVGGIAGLVAMRLGERLVAPLVRQRAPRATDIFASGRSISLVGSHHNLDEAANDAIARIAYEKLAGHTPTDEQKRRLSRLIHVGYGLAIATLYGAFQRSRVRRPSRTPIERAIRSGTWFGIGLWLLGDELAIPLLGLADKPTAYHPTRHLQSLVAHVGYGVATATTTRALRSVS